MKHLLSLLSVCAVALSLASCVGGMPGAMGPGYGSPPPAYRPAPSPYYGGGYDRDHNHRDHNYNPPSNSNNRNYYGGPAEWYKSGLALGARDRKQHVKANYRRHNTQYDGKTQSEFARGYNDGYRRG